MPATFPTSELSYNIPCNLISPIHSSQSASSPKRFSSCSLKLEPHISAFRTIREIPLHEVTVRYHASREEYLARRIPILTDVEYGAHGQAIPRAVVPVARR